MIYKGINIIKNSRRSYLKSLQRGKVLRVYACAV